RISSVAAAGLAALRRTDEQLERLRALLSGMDVVNDPSEWVRLDGEFHLCIAQSSGNVVFVSVVDDIREALSEHSKMLNTVPRRKEASGVEHRAIVEAIAEGSSERASGRVRIAWRSNACRQTPCARRRPSISGSAP
ncbi:MAG: hypothetical protein QOI25_2155, partial [Mycobacterium sp.]|nr:hypothetical protein [Mycobacterium sp.]